MEPLAVLEGRLIFEGDILFTLTTTAMRALKPWRTDLALRMEHVGPKPPEDACYWATDTHWKGQQVLFWDVADIPAPKDRNLYCRLKEQLETRRRLRAD